MTSARSRALEAMGGLLGIAAAGYTAYVGASWLRYGHPPRPRNGEQDGLLDLFMPTYEIAERHKIDVAAPTEATFAALMRMSMEDSLLIRAIFKGRELLLGAEPSPAMHRSLVEVTKSLGWVVLAEVPGHEIVMGAVTRPGEANVVFRSVPAEEFATFAEPDYVKIVWTLRADSAGPEASIARTETRAIATDEAARRKFRWYWARFSAGIVLIRRMSLGLVKQEAERDHVASGKSIVMTVPPVSGPSI
jgi:hypothetical protein